MSECEAPLCNAPRPRKLYRIDPGIAMARRILKSTHGLTRTAEAKGARALYYSGVAFGFEFPKRACRQWCRNLKWGALAAAQRRGFRGVPVAGPAVPAGRPWCCAGG